ncbi:MAG: peptidylprolyl isomerase [Pseudomonadota bacterium]
MKKNLLSLALCAGLASSVFAEPAKLTAPSAPAPKVNVPTSVAPSAKASDATKRAAATEQSATQEPKVEQIKIPEIEKLTKGHYTQAHVDSLVKNFAARGQRPLTPEVKEMIKNNLISQAIVVQEARKQGITKRADVKAQIDLYGDNIIVGAFLSDYFKANPVNEADAKKEYDAFVAQNAGKKEYQARHILVEKEDEAKQIIEQLKKGESFEKLAKQHTKDEGSKASGGDLGWAIPQESFVPPFAEALVGLEKGKFTETPVKSKFGYHVIQLVDVRGAKAPEFEQVKARIIEGLKAKKLEQLIAGLRAKNK